MSLLKEMLTEPSKKVDFVINGIHHGRGDKYEDNYYNLQHTTTTTTTWKIQNKELKEITSPNVFINNETYLIQWNYTTIDLKTNTKEENTTYFYWKGDKASKGHSPLPESVEEAPVERITQWSEPPVFLNLFRGKWIVYDENLEQARQRLFILRGELPSELHLFEVDLKKASLRSRTCFVLINTAAEQNLPDSVVIWYGSKSTQIAQKNIRDITGNLFGESFDEVYEEKADNKFFKIFSDANVNDYNSLVKAETFGNLNHTPQLFYFNSISGTFLASRIESSHKSEEVCAFPVLQNHLYTAPQPAVFLLDDFDTIWLWKGWENGENDNFKSECEQAAEIAKNYANEKSTRAVLVKEVSAGNEPVEFTNLFPTWKSLPI